MCHGKGPPDLYVHFTILLLDVCYQFTIVLPAAYVLLYILLTAAFMFHIVDISCGICSFLYTTRSKMRLGYIIIDDICATCILFPLRLPSQ